MQIQLRFQSFSYCLRIWRESHSFCVQRVHLLQRMEYENNHTVVVNLINMLLRLPTTVCLQLTLLYGTYLLFEPRIKLLESFQLLTFFPSCIGQIVMFVAEKKQNLEKLYCK